MHLFLYKQKFYKKHQADIGKTTSKSQAKPWGWTLASWKLFAFFIQVIIQQ